MNGTASITDGTFSREHVYTFAELRRRGLGSAMLRELQRRGMKARRCGKLKIVLGDDLFDAFAQLPVETLTPREKR